MSIPMLTYCLQTPSVRRCSWYWKPWSRRSASPSCCTTCSTCRSRRSHRSSVAPKLLQGNSQAGRVAEFKGWTRRPKPTSAAGEKWSRPFLLPQGKVTLRNFAPCSIQMSYSEPTPPQLKRQQQIKLAERRSYGVRSKATTPSPRLSRDVRELHNLRSSTVFPEPSGLRGENHGSFSFLRFSPTRSCQSI